MSLKRKRTDLPFPQNMRSLNFWNRKWHSREEAANTDSSTRVYLPSLRTVRRLKKIINRVAILTESDPVKTRNSTVRKRDGFRLHNNETYQSVARYSRRKHQTTRNRLTFLIFHVLQVAHTIQDTWKHCFQETAGWEERCRHRWFPIFCQR